MRIYKLLFVPLFLFISCKDNSVNPLVNSANDLKISRIEITIENVNSGLKILTRDDSNPSNPQSKLDSSTQMLSYKIIHNIDPAFVITTDDAYDYHYNDKSGDRPGNHSLYLKFNDSKTHLESFKYDFTTGNQSTQGNFIYHVFSQFHIAQDNLKPIISNDSVLVFDLAPISGFISKYNFWINNTSETRYVSDTLIYTNTREESTYFKTIQNKNVVYRITIYKK